MVHATTIIGVLHQGSFVMAGDGQVTLGTNQSIMKHGAKKIRRLADGKVLAGFAGSAADGVTLFDRFDAKLGEFNGNLARACVELAKAWRTDRYLRRLEAMLIVGDNNAQFLLSGAGDVIQPDDGVLSIGSGSSYALAAARALQRHAGSELSAVDIARSAMAIAAELCPFTNRELQLEEINGS